ncbi:hypothetical protein QVD99_006720 [Batrachochytrium dendrobatidis]|nr:hypothetical protein QVD99_006720 [Batrachochytrium dendrobatidis]
MYCPIGYSIKINQQLAKNQSYPERMALAFSKIWRQRSTAIVDDYFQWASDADENSQQEYDAAATIQKYWRRYVCRTYFLTLSALALRIQRVFRGHLGRVKAAKIAVELSRQRRIKFYSDMVTKIQKVWRGWSSRKKQFDFYARKRYIIQITQKMDDMRELLKVKEVQQKELFESQDIIRKKEKLLQIASNRHHLIGTKAVPGVYARVQTASAVRQPDFIDSCGHVDVSVIIPESRLRHNPGLDKWIHEHIGKNPNWIRIKPIKMPEPTVSESAKPAQGPFLPKYRLLERIKRPLHPSLRVETNYYDFQTFASEEKRKNMAFRISDKAFSAGKVPDTISDNYLLRNEPYIPKNSGLFVKDCTASKRVSMRANPERMHFNQT